MSFFEELRLSTACEARMLASVPQLTDALAGRITKAAYIAYLGEAYHHVKHTAPLMAAAKARLGSAHGAFRDALDDYIAEETGHEAWILQDLEACGADAEAVRTGRPNAATEIMIAYAYDYVNRVNPMGYFGMVYVLESTSVLLAAQGAGAVQGALHLPDNAFTYLRSHGGLDQEHMKFFASLMNIVAIDLDRAAIARMAQMMFHLFANVFRSMPAFEE